MSRLYTTRRLEFAAWLLTTSRLSFRGCEPADSRNVVFAFDDPEGVGEQARQEFMAGAECSAKGLYDSVRFLRTQMTKTLNKSGVMENGNRSPR